MPPTGNIPRQGKSASRRELVELSGQGADEGEAGWLMSYLDVLTLLVTLFVLLLALAGPQAGSFSPAGQASGGGGTRSAGTGVLPAGPGLLPRQQGVAPALADLDVDGISVESRPEGVVLRIEERLLFDSGAAAIKTGGGAVLDELAVLLGQVEGNISVEGHTDSRPIRNARFPSNWELSAGRAAAVLRQLSARGIAGARLRAVAYGDTRPLAGNDSARGRQANRRVELLVTPAG